MSKESQWRPGHPSPYRSCCIQNSRRRFSAPEAAPISRLRGPDVRLFALARDRSRRHNVRCLVPKRFPDVGIESSQRKAFDDEPEIPLTGLGVWLRNQRLLGLRLCGFPRLQIGRGERAGRRSGRRGCGRLVWARRRARWARWRGRSHDTSRNWRQGWRSRHGRGRDGRRGEWQRARRSEQRRRSARSSWRRIAACELGRGSRPGQSSANRRSGCGQCRSGRSGRCGRSGR